MVFQNLVLDSIMFVISSVERGDRQHSKDGVTLQVIQDIGLVFMTDNTIINHKVNVQGKNIIEGSRRSGWC